LNITKGALLGILATLMLFFVLASPPPAAATPTANVVTTTVNLQVQPLYDVYGSGTTYAAVTLVASAITAQNESLTISSSILPTYHTGFAIVDGHSENLTLSVTPGAFYTITFALPDNTSAFQLTYYGTFNGASFLWRYLSPSSFVETATSNPSLYASAPIIEVTVPAGTVVSQLYGFGGGAIPLNQLQQQNATPGYLTYVMPPSAGLIVLQSHLFLPASIAVTAAALVVVALAALNLFKPGKAFYDGLARRIWGIGGGLKRALRIPASGGAFSIRALLKPRTLLALFIICALVMVALAAAGGPDSRTKAYVVANPGTTMAVQTELQQITGNALVLGPQQDYSDFNVMSSVGQFNLIVISNYPQASLNEEIGFILPYMGNVPVIMFDSGANSTLVTSIKELYPEADLLQVQNVTSLTSAQENQLVLYLNLNQRTNILGITLGDSSFKLLLATEAVFSMLLVFVGWAYLGSLASEPRTTTDLYNLLIIISAGIFVFFFSETIYVVTSSLLAVPISLHAVNSDAHDVTAIGLLGFGGGSTPRLAVGVVGLILGALGAEGGLRARKSDFVLVAGVVLVLMANPLAIGEYIFQGILLFFPLGNLAFGSAYADSLSFKGFIYGFGQALGGGINGTYVLSAGKILYFAGLAPLAYVRKLGRITTVLGVFVVAFLVGDGGVRVGEMTPEKTVVAVVPGLVVGFVFVAIFLAFAAMEKYVRGNWKSRN
jgi:hypothetical protein